MDYSALFDTAIERIRNTGRHVESVKNPPAAAGAVSAAERLLNVQFPKGLRRFYSEYADGLFIYWGEEDDEEGPFGGIEMPSLANLIENCQPWRDRASVNGAVPPTFLAHVGDAAKATATHARMRHWLPVVEWGNGDWMGIDLADGSAIYHRHDWFDGGPGTDGHVLAPSWDAWLTEWADVRSSNRPDFTGRNASPRRWESPGRTMSSRPRSATGKGCLTGRCPDAYSTAVPDAEDFAFGRRRFSGHRRGKCRPVHSGSKSAPFHLYGPQRASANAE